MILRNKRWDVGLKAVALVLLTLMLLLPARNISFAFSPSTPLEVDSPLTLLGDGAYENRFVATEGAPQPGRILPYVRYGVLYFYYPVAGTDGNVFVRTMDPPQSDKAVRLVGRWVTYNSVAFSGPVRSSYSEAFGDAIPNSAWIILLDETPDTFKAVMFAYIPLLFLWLIVLYLLVRGVQGKGVLPGSGPKRWVAKASDVAS